MLEPSIRSSCAGRHAADAGSSLRRAHRDPGARQLAVHPIPVGARPGAGPLALALALRRVVDALAAHGAAAIARAPAALERVPAEVLMPLGPAARGAALAHG